MTSSDQVHFWRPDKTLIRSELNEYFTSGYLTDLQVICGKRVFNIHKLVLASASEYMLYIFNQDSEIDQIILSEYHEKDVEAFMNDLYEMPNIPDSKVDYLSILNLLKIEPKECNQIDMDYDLSTSMKQEVNGDDYEYEHISEDPMDCLTSLVKFHPNEISERPDTCKEKPPFLKGKDKTKEKGKGNTKTKEKGDLIYRENGKKLIGVKTFTKDDNLEEAIDGIEYKYEGNKNVIEKNKKKEGGIGRPRKEGLTSLMVKERNRVKYRLGQQVTCTECGEVKKNKSDLLAHHTMAHGRTKQDPREKLTCPTCGKSVERRNFKYHLAKHDPDADLSRFEKFECDKCGKKFQYGYQKKKHGACEIESSYFIDNQERIVCALCLHVFNDLKEVLPHKKENHLMLNQRSKLPIYDCPIDDCDKKFSNISKVKRHLQYYHFSMKPYPCTECEEKFSNTTLMRTHRQDVHGLGADLQCETCGEKFFSQSKLDNHVYLKHSTEKHHLCSLCSKTYKNKTDLKRHMISHDMNNSPFECEQCGKKFRDKTTLGYHINTHTGEKPFKCPFCSYAAASYPVLHLHKIKCPYATS